MIKLSRTVFLYHAPPLSYREAVANDVRWQDIQEAIAWGQGKYPFKSIANSMRHDFGELFWGVSYRGVPAFLFGLREHEGIHHLVGFGTSKTKRVMPALTRWGLGTWRRMLFEDYGVQRIECRIPVSSVHSFEWLSAMMKVERQYIHPGPRKSLFWLLSYSKSDFESEVHNVPFSRSSEVPAHSNTSNSPD